MPKLNCIPNLSKDTLLHFGHANFSSYHTEHLCDEALAKYNYRHLKAEDTFRTSCFIKMLELAAKFGFNPNLFEAPAKPWLEKIEGEAIAFANQSAEIEYIPYPHLWQYGLEILNYRG
ncbi:MAG: hypothetical protein AAF573_03040 [Bacteroidota bacterium]